MLARASASPAAGAPDRRRPRSRSSSARSNRSGTRRSGAEPSGVPSSKYARRYHVAVPPVGFHGGGVVVGLAPEVGRRLPRRPGPPRERRRLASVATRNQASHTLSPRPSIPTRFIPSFQSPMPISGSPCAPLVQARRSARRQCSYTLPVSVGDLGQVVDLVLVGRQLPHREERHVLVEHRRVAGDRDVVIHDVRQPHEIVGEAGPDAAPALRVPPVLHVALDELARRPRAGCARARRAGSAYTSAITSWSWSRNPYAPLLW